MFGHTNAEGLSEYLTGKKQLQDLIVRTKIGKLSMLTAGDVPSNPTELISSAMMKVFLQEIKGRYQDRFIIIDSTPTHGTAEASVLAKQVYGIILVIMALKSPQEAIQKIVNDLGKQKILSIVFNGYSRTYQNYYKYYKALMGKMKD